MGGVTTAIHPIVTEIFPGIGVDRFHGGVEWVRFRTYNTKALLVAPAHVHEVAGFMARLAREEGIALSPYGETALARLTMPEPVVKPRPRPSPSTPSGPSPTQPPTPGMEPDLPGAARACLEVVLDVPPWGRVEVRCNLPGSHGMVWHNVIAKGYRWGWNGSRWSHFGAPPTEILRAIREAGVTVFPPEL